MPEGQRHLTHPGRSRIHALMKSGLSAAAVARQLGRGPSSVPRGIRRNGGARGQRRAQAQRRAEGRRSAAPSVPSRMTPEPVALVEGRLVRGWSPEQVSGRLRLEGHPMTGRQWTCRHVHADRRAGGGLWRHLRRRGKRPNRRGGAHAGRGHIPGRVDIPGRPAVVEAKARVGDREADTNQRQGHRRRRGVPGGPGVEIHAPAACRQQDGGRGRGRHDRPSGAAPRRGAHGHRRQRQGVRGPRAGGRGARRGLPVRAALPLPGARPDRAHQRPRMPSEPALTGGGGFAEVGGGFPLKSRPLLPPPSRPVPGPGPPPPGLAAAERGLAPQDGSDRNGPGSHSRIRAPAWSARPPVSLPRPDGCRVREPDRHGHGSGRP